jgi:ADP-ribose pyrophosphatase YjhB (NUDIX family)
MKVRKYPLRPWVSVFAFIFNKENEVLLTKRAKPPRIDHWFPPGGMIELGETALTAVKREILEETGVQVNNLRFIDYFDGITYNDDGKVIYHNIVLIFIADYLTGFAQANDDALDLKWIPFKKILAQELVLWENQDEILKKIKIG